MSAIANLSLNGRRRLWLSGQAPIGTTSPPPSPPPTYTPASGTRTANRFDLVLFKSAVAVGTAVSGLLIPNAAWTADPISLAGNGTFAASTITPTAGDTGSIAITFTPAQAGELMVSASSAGRRYDPYGAPLTVFTPSFGTPRTLTASLRFPDQCCHQRDTASGNPAGFNLPWARGFGEVWFNVGSISGATDGLWVRLYDALSPGASTAQGSGTALHAPVQVYGAISAAGRVRVLLPAGPYHYYAEIATDAGFTNPIRIAQRFSVGHVIAQLSRSQESGFSRSYAYGAGTSLATTYAKTVAWMAYDIRYASTDCGWFRHDGASADPYQYHYGEGSSSGTQEMGRILEQQLGVVCAITGESTTGGGVDAMFAHDGTIIGGFPGTVSASCGGKFRWLMTGSGGWDGVDGAYPTQTAAEDDIRFAGAADWIAKHYPSCAVIGLLNGATGVFGGDGSSAIGYTRFAVFLMSLEATNPMVVSKENYAWNEFKDGHATMAARIHYVRPSMRLMLAAEVVEFGGFHTNDRGPIVSGAGALPAGSRVVTIPVKLQGGSGLRGVTVTTSNPNSSYGPASADELASLVALYPRGGFAGDGQTKPIATTGVSLRQSNANPADWFLDTVLAGASGITYADGSTAAMPSNGLTAHVAADFGASRNSAPQGCGRAPVICDDRDDLGIVGLGWHLRPAVDVPIVLGA